MSFLSGTLYHPLLCATNERQITLRASCPEGLTSSSSFVTDPQDSAGEHGNQALFTCHLSFAWFSGSPGLRPMHVLVFGSVTEDELGTGGIGP